jgi:hypothetical protein
MAHIDMIDHTCATRDFFFWEAQLGVHPIEKILDIDSGKGSAGEKIFSYPLAFLIFDITSKA